MDRIDLAGSECTYLQVADSIAARIKTGEFTYRLPTERKLALEYEVAYQTLRQAMVVLRDRGLVVTRMGRGTFTTPGEAAARAYDDPRSFLEKFVGDVEAETGSGLAR